MEPHFSPAQNTLGLAYLQLGMIEESIVELDNARVCSGNQPAARAALAHALALAGRRAEAESLTTTPQVSKFWLAIVNIGLGAQDAAFHCLHEARENCEPWLVWLRTEPRFDPLREDVRFDRLLRGWRGL
jgi:hypothetical protein